MEKLRASRSPIWSRLQRVGTIGLGVAGLLLAVTADLAAAPGAPAPLPVAGCGPIIAGLTAAPARPAEAPSVAEPPAGLMRAFHTCTAAAPPRRVHGGWVAIGPLRRG